jgi:hypothetical protein
MSHDLLVVYYSQDGRMRATTRDYLTSFRRYADVGCRYVNAAVPTSMWGLADAYEAVVFDYSVLAERSNRSRFERLVSRIRPLRDRSAVRIALPQDEYTDPGRLCAFIRELDITAVFSVLERGDWAALYDPDTLNRIHSTVLTGYLEPARIREIDDLAASGGPRPIDVGYRARDLPIWLGREAQRKGAIGRLAAEIAADLGLAVDISVHPQDVFHGSHWYRFLLNLRWTLGVEGGATLVDRDGTVRAAVDAYVERHPAASFDEVEAACFPGKDGAITGMAISPRHLEACATSTAQILVEGAYSGILQPWTHYVPVRRDLSDLRDALMGVRDDRLRGDIVATARADIVESGRYSYARFVHEVLEGALGRTIDRDRAGRMPPATDIVGLASRAWLGGRHLTRSIGRTVLRDVPRSLARLSSSGRAKVRA